jgi:arylsulfatase A
VHSLKHTKFPEIKNKYFYGKRFNIHNKFVIKKGPVMKSNQPNIIYILVDDMGYGDLSSNNPHSKIPTPNLEKLASQGMRFTDAHAPSSVCTPSRYSILTGRYCWRTDLKQYVLWPWDPSLIEEDRQTVGNLLKNNGYTTACIGKWHLGWDWTTKNGAAPNEGTQIGKFDEKQRHALEKNIDYSQPIKGGPIDRGFDSYFGVDVPNFPPFAWFEQDRLTEIPTIEKPPVDASHLGKMIPGWKDEQMIPAFVNKMNTFIDESSSKPFFLYLSLTSPHTPIAPNKEFIGSSDAGLYGDFVCEVDWVVGQVMEALKRNEVEDNTLIFFTSDNGPEVISAADGGAYERVKEQEHYSMAEYRGAKRDTWEGGHRVPFIAKWPDMIPPNTVCDQLISLGDLMATCADILKVELKPGEAEDSVSIYSLLQGSIDTSVRDFAVHCSASGTFAIRKGDWVLIDNPSGDDNGRFGGEPEWFKEMRGYTSHQYPGELFNIREDISEKANLYGDYPEIVKELSGLLKQVKLHGPNQFSSIDSDLPISE